MPKKSIRLLKDVSIRTAGQIVQVLDDLGGGTANCRVVGISAWVKRDSSGELYRRNFGHLVLSANGGKDLIGPVAVSNGRLVDRPAQTGPWAAIPSTTGAAINAIALAPPYSVAPSMAFATRASTAIGQRVLFSYDGQTFALTPSDSAIPVGWECRAIVVGRNNVLVSASISGVNNRIFQATLGPTPSFSDITGTLPLAFVCSHLSYIPGDANQPGKYYAAGAEAGQYRIYSLTEGLSTWVAETFLLPAPIAPSGVTALGASEPFTVFANILASPPYPFDLYYQISAAPWQGVPNIPAARPAQLLLANSAMLIVRSTTNRIYRLFTAQLPSGTWQDITDNLPLAFTATSACLDQEGLVLTGQNGAAIQSYRSEGLGNSWSGVSAGLGALTSSGTVLFDPVRGRMLLATNAGVFAATTRRILTRRYQSWFYALLLRLGLSRLVNTAWRFRYTFMPVDVCLQGPRIQGHFAHNPLLTVPSPSTPDLVTVVLQLEEDN